MNKKILLHNPRTYAGIGHALKTWNFGLHLSLYLNANWIKCQKRESHDTGGIHGTTVKEFLEYFGLTEEIENKKFKHIYDNNEVLELPDLNHKGLLEYIKKNSKYDVFFLDSEKYPRACSNYGKSSREWFQKRKTDNSRNLCNKENFNISLAIRRGDRVFIPHIKIPNDEWFLNKLKEVLKIIDDPRPIKIHLFAETYNETWHHRGGKIAGKKWSELKKIVHPEGRWLFDEFINKNFKKIENIYIDDTGKPSDIEKMFSDYNTKLYLNENILTVLDTLIESDVVISKLHGTSDLIRFYSDRDELINDSFFIKNK